MNGETEVAFTRDDRDLLLSMDAKLDNLTARTSLQGRRLNRHNTRISKLEALRDRGEGAAWAIKLLWVCVAAIAGLFGIHLAKH